MLRSSRCALIVERETTAVIGEGAPAFARSSLARTDVAAMLGLARAPPRGLGRVRRGGPFDVKALPGL